MDKDFDFKLFKKCGDFVTSESFIKFSQMVSQGEMDFAGWSNWMKPHLEKHLGDEYPSECAADILKQFFELISNDGKRLRTKYFGDDKIELTNKKINSIDSIMNRKQRRNQERQERKKNKSNQTRLIQFPDGKGTFGEVPMKNDSANGLAKFYWKSGKLKVEVNMVNGQEHGSYRSYYENGQVEYETNRKNNLVHGHQKHYYENGQLWVENNWVNSQLHGESKVWWSNGKPKSFGYFKNNKHHGFFREWNENGELTSEESYVDGNVINPQVA
jgi:antitoxin component YwqK of YwqJK toxin-antitoxin module